MNNRIASKTLDFVGISSAFAKKALDEINTLRGDASKAAGLSSDTLNLMVETNTVGEHQKEAAASMLQSHAQTLELLQNAVRKIASLEETTKSASDLGHAVDAVSAGIFHGSSYDSLADPFVGRYTSQKKASDDAILAVLDR